MIWLDAQLSPKLASWIISEYQIETFSLRELGFLKTTDKEIFFAARNKPEVIIMSKDSDFIDLQNRYGSPPKIIWIRSGNTSNESMKELLKKTLNKVLVILKSGENIVEIAD